MRASARPDLNYPEFERAAVRAKQRGYDVHSPVTLDKTDFPALTYEVASKWDTEQLKTVFRRDVNAVFQSDCIALLEGWETSTGAKAELALAMALKMEILDAYNFHPLEVSMLAYTHSSHVCSSGCSNPEIDLARRIADGD